MRMLQLIYMFPTARLETSSLAEDGPTQTGFSTLAQTQHHHILMSTCASSLKLLIANGWTTSEKTDMHAMRPT